MRYKCKTWQWLFLFRIYVFPQTGDICFKGDLGPWRLLWPHRATETRRSTGTTKTPVLHLCKGIVQHFRSDFSGVCTVHKKLHKSSLATDKQVHHAWILSGAKLKRHHVISLNSQCKPTERISVTAERISCDFMIDFLARLEQLSFQTQVKLALCLHHKAVCVIVSLSSTPCSYFNRSVITTLSLLLNSKNQGDDLQVILLSKLCLSASNAMINRCISPFWKGDSCLAMLQASLSGIIYSSTGTLFERHHVTCIMTGVEHLTHKDSLLWFCSFYYKIKVLSFYFLFYFAVLSSASSHLILPVFALSVSPVIIHPAPP